MATARKGNMGAERGRCKAAGMNEPSTWRVRSGLSGIATCGKLSAMNGPPPNEPHQMDTDAVLRVKLEVLRREHRDLDDAIHALHDRGRGDMLVLQRLKRRKLALKDMIAQLEDRLLPDIIA